MIVLIIRVTHLSEIIVSQKKKNFLLSRRYLNSVEYKKCYAKPSGEIPTQEDRSLSVIGLQSFIDCNLYYIYKHCRQF